jgi:hypothetical protein
MFINLNPMSNSLTFGAGSNPGSRPGIRPPCVASVL